jgi:hypothetical protein
MTKKDFFFEKNRCLQITELELKSTETSFEHGVHATSFTVFWRLVQSFGGA